MKRLVFFAGILILSYAASAQNLTQVIRGTILDKDSRLPLPGANVLLLNSNHQMVAISDGNGCFRINNVPVGRQSIQISFVGYKSSALQNLIVNSAKKIILEIELEENVTEVKEVTVVANKRKDQPINKMASVRARTFTVEETEKYAGSRGDIARMAMN